MIITVTVNPAIDVIYSVRDRVRANGLNRAKNAMLCAGGKGINVSRAMLDVIKSVDSNSGKQTDIIQTASFIGGYTGNLLRQKLSDEGINLTAIETAAETRVNICAVSEDGDACEINAPGGPIQAHELDHLTNIVVNAVKAGDTAVLCGSMPKVEDADGLSYWANLTRSLKEKGCRVILDCSGEALRRAVESDVPPDMIKPNLDELLELTGGDFSGGFSPSEWLDDLTENQLYKRAEEASESIVKKGISVLATLGSHGSVYTSADAPKKHIRQRCYPAEQVVNIKGAGDTFLGAFIVNRYLLEKDIPQSMRAASLAASQHVSGGGKSEADGQDAAIAVSPRLKKLQRELGSQNIVMFSGGEMPERTKTKQKEEED